MDKVLKAVPLEDWRIEILTSSGVAGVFDVKPYAHLKSCAMKPTSGWCGPLAMALPGRTSRTSVQIPLSMISSRRKARRVTG